MKQPSELLRQQVLRQADEHRDWLEERWQMLASDCSERELHIVMGMAPRILGKAQLTLEPDALAQFDAMLPGWQPVDWSLDSAARVVSLAIYRGERPFAAIFKDLRRTADTRELIALYQGLPFYPAPESLAFDVGEALRSNISDVFRAVVHHNPYPQTYFDGHRWNHMVLKALFINLPLQPILGLLERNNPELACQLVDHVKERWAAGRDISIEVWRCIAPYAIEANALDIFEQAINGTSKHGAAAALSLAANPDPRAQALLAANPRAQLLVDEGLAKENLVNEDLTHRNSLLKREDA